MISIAIDGPSGAGKSSLSQAVAERLQYLYIDTGAMFRAIALAAIRKGVEPEDEAGVTALLPEISVNFRPVDGEQHVYLGDEDVTYAIRDEYVGKGSSAVGKHRAVREHLLAIQRRMASGNDVIMDGRDIGTVVLPNANIKIYLTASVEERAKRRYQQLLAKGLQPDLEQVKKDVIERDHQDMTREIAPLKKADDAVEMNTSGATFEESLERLLKLIEHRLSTQKTDSPGDEAT